MSNEEINLSTLDLKGDGDIVATLSSYFGVDKKDIENQNRQKEIVRVRDIIIYLLRKYGDMSYPTIGRLIGGRDHTTMIYSYKKTEKNIKDNPAFEKSFFDLISKAKEIKERKSSVEKELVPEIIALTETQQKVSQNTQVFKEIPERNLKILELWREGLTLENIGKLFNVTRERIRQLVVSTLKQMAVNESISKGIVMNSEIIAEEESKKRRIVKQSKRLAGKPTHPAKEKRWSRYYLACRSCGTTAIPHVRGGLCEQCIGQFRSDRREDIIERAGNKCEVCSRSRAEAITLYGRDLHITKDKKVLCRGCFLKLSGEKMGEYRNYTWSRFYPECKVCGTTSVPHAQKGLCRNCSTQLTYEKREYIIAKHSSKCDLCGMDRNKVKKSFGRDLFITKSGKVFCRRCFLKRID